jgi:hypothetical protein
MPDLLTVNDAGDLLDKVCFINRLADETRKAQFPRLWHGDGRFRSRYGSDGYVIVLWNSPV